MLTHFQNGQKPKQAWPRGRKQRQFALSGDSLELLLTKVRNPDLIRLRVQCRQRHRQAAALEKLRHVHVLLDRVNLVLPGADRDRRHAMLVEPVGVEAAVGKQRRRLQARAIRPPVSRASRPGHLSANLNGGYDGFARRTSPPPSRRRHPSLPPAPWRTPRDRP